MQGSTKARIHTVFTRRISELRNVAGRIAAAFTGSGGRPWNVPEALAERDLLDVPGLHDDAFHRDELNINYADVVRSANAPGTAADAMALKMQVDYTAQEERAFRARHASVVRCLVHAHGRLDGHGKNGVFQAVQQQAEDVIKAGGT